MERRMAEPIKYQVIRDTREKQNFGWTFPISERCHGTVEEAMMTGDYTLRGFEKLFVIERKGTMAEFARNLVETRFHDEMCRLDEIAHPFLVLEFEFSNIMTFPAGSGIPQDKWKYLRLTPQAILQKVHELQIRHRAKILFAGKFGRECASSLFKRVMENVKAPG
jgi:hypothetical protein